MCFFILFCFCKCVLIRIHGFKHIFPKCIWYVIDTILNENIYPISTQAKKFKDGFKSKIWKRKHQIIGRNKRVYLWHQVRNIFFKKKVKKKRSKKERLCNDFLKNYHFCNNKSNLKKYHKQSDRKYDPLGKSI